MEDVKNVFSYFQSELKQKAQLFFGVSLSVFI